jgi:uncharacterized protein DUF4386
MTAKNAGRLVAMLLLVQMLLGPVVNFRLLAPIFAPPGFLEQAAAHAGEMRLAIALGLVMGALAIGIAIAAWPVVRARSVVLALALAAAAALSFAASAVEHASLLSMLSLSDAYATASGAEADALRNAADGARAWRNTTHDVGLIAGGVFAFALYVVAFGLALVPRWLAGFGILAALIEIGAIVSALAGNGVVFALLAPLGLAHLALMIRLFAKGFAERPAPAAA